MTKFFPERLGTPWGHLGGVLGHLGSVLGRLGGLLGLSQGPRRRTNQCGAGSTHTEHLPRRPQANNIKRT